MAQAIGPVGVGCCHVVVGYGYKLVKGVVGSCFCLAVGGLG